MASPSLNLHSLPSSSRSCPSFSLPNSGCHVSATSLTFQAPKKRTQISCLCCRGSGSVHSIKRQEPVHGLFAVGTPQHGAVYSIHKPEVADGNLMAAKAAGVDAPTSDEPTSRQSKSSKKGKGTKYPRRIIDMYQILKNPVITEAAIKNIAEENSLLFTVDIRADKDMIKDAVKNFFGAKVRKVNTSIRPDGTKKAFIMLSKEYNASDLAKSIGIFPSSD